MMEQALSHHRFEEGEEPYPDFSTGILKVTESDRRPTYVHRAAPCQGACPSGHDIRGWLNIVNGIDKPKNGMAWQEYAFRRMTEANPFPALMGRCCPAPCQESCNRGAADEHVGINSIEHFIGQWALDKGLSFEIPETWSGKRIAIVGGGPAGLSCAYQLRRMGHTPVIFEANEKLGGMLQYGLSTHRCPREVVDAEIQRILDMGIDVLLSTRVGTDVTLEHLEREFDAVFWAIGAQVGRPLPIPGAQAANVVDGLAFLRAANLGKLRYLSGKVLVIGGGETALDCASVALRLGNLPNVAAGDRPENVLSGETEHAMPPDGRTPGDVMIVYRRPKERAPAHLANIEDCISEGVQWREGLAPVAVVLDEYGSAKALRVVPVDWVDNRTMVPREGEEFDIECSLIVGATGQRSDFTGIETLDNGRGWTETDSLLRVKDKPQHFVGGDVVNPALLTTAIGHGWKAAEGIDAYLDGRQPAARPTVDAHTFQVASVNTEGSTGRDFSARTIHNLEDRSALDTQSVDKLFLGHFARSPNMRRGLKQLGPDGIVGNFEERLVPLEEEQIVAEAERCMSCGLCFECDNCAVYCPKSAVLRVKPERRSMGRYVVTDYSRCVGCHICADVCPTGYIEMAATP